MLISIELEVENVHQIADALGLVVPAPNKIGFATDDVAILQEALETERSRAAGLQYQIDTLTAQIIAQRAIDVMPTEARDVVSIAGSVEVDDHGNPYDPEVHATSKSKNTDGTWRMKRGMGKKMAPITNDPPRVSIDDATPAEFDAASAAARAKTPTIDEVREALRQYRATFKGTTPNEETDKAASIEAARKILIKYGATIIPEIKTTDYAKLIAELQAAGE